MEYLSARVIKLTAALPSALKVNMTPKAMQNLSDKGEGARPARVGKDSGGVAPAGRRPTSGATKPSGKNTGGTAKDGKNVTGIANRTETRAESRRARIAIKHLQGTVRKVAKSCTEIKEKLNMMEDKAMAVEADLKSLKEQLESHGGQLTDIMW
ncbi:hypothetical protein NDU88_007239 [Pleurodeles waltl]|uniref:Uncharacterized protein n=1 Tax=Pleurodeles waltl TaxID=8319 RepID=A0AAV7SRU1_PLEWA|nr:hypothetical protein NDU88_007239 [Pleurodeles waltl]